MILPRYRRTHEVIARLRFNSVSRKNVEPSWYASDDFHVSVNSSWFTMRLCRVIPNIGSGGTNEHSPHSASARGCFFVLRWRVYWTNTLFGVGQQLTKNVRKCILLVLKLTYSDPNCTKMEARGEALAKTQTALLTGLKLPNGKSLSLTQHQQLYYRTRMSLCSWWQAVSEDF